MRETFTSGSTRGEWVAPLAGSPSLLLYREVASCSFLSAHREQGQKMLHSLVGPFSKSPIKKAVTAGLSRHCNGGFTPPLDVEIHRGMAG